MNFLGTLETPSGRCHTCYRFIEKMRPILAKPNTRSIRWQICDPFLRFWFRYIEGNQGLIDNGMSSVLEHEIAES